SDKVNITEENKMQGYSNTVALTAYNAQQSDNDLKVLPITAIAEYAKNHPAPANSSGWYFPSIMELKYMCWGQGNSSGNSGKELLDTQFNKVSGASSFAGNYCWSSSEAWDYNVNTWGVAFNTDFRKYWVHKSWSNSVRSILAF
ncbi:MAG: hypothetical protein RSB52_08870, partial [Acidaminococcaceae bacterium]